MSTNGRSRRKLNGETPAVRPSRAKTKSNKKVTKLARPRKLTDKLILECVELIKEGLPIDKVCDYLSITSATFYYWKDKGERYLNELHDPRGPSVPGDEDYAVFVQTVVRAKAEWQLELLRRSFTDKFKATWVRDMTMMERRDRQNWGRSESFAAVTSAPLPDDSYL